MRGHFFRLIKQLPNTGDPDPYIIPRVKLLDALTEQGKDILHFEDEIGPFLKKFFPVLLSRASTLSTSNIHTEKEYMGSDLLSKPMLINYFLNMLLNVIKFNSAYLDAEVVTPFVNHLNEICLMEDNIPENVKVCLQVTIDLHM